MDSTVENAIYTTICAIGIPANLIVIVAIIPRLAATKGNTLR